MIHHYIIKAKTNSYFRILYDIDEVEDTHELDQLLIDEDLKQNDEDDNHEVIMQQNEEIKSGIIEIVKEEQIIKEKFDEINNSECIKILQYILYILCIFIFLYNKWRIETNLYFLLILVKYYLI